MPGLAGAATGAGTAEDARGGHSRKPVVLLLNNVTGAREEEMITGLWESQTVIMTL